MTICEPRPRLLPDRVFPSYAYLPGRFPHPLRHPLGHSYNPAPASSLDEASSDPEALRWGMDLFNHGFYWEAHEAWEPLWLAADQGSANRALLKGLILMAAAGVKRREGKAIAAGRHGRRAAALLRDDALGNSALGGMLGISKHSQPRRSYPFRQGVRHRARLTTRSHSTSFSAWSFFKRVAPVSTSGNCRLYAVL